MKDKTIAGILALFLGWLGLHRFYLGQVGRGILYLIFCWFPLIWLIAFIDAIMLLSMDSGRFDRKYNRTVFENYRNQESILRRRQYPADPFAADRPTQMKQEKKADTIFRDDPVQGNAYKKSGLEKFRDFDYQGAIEDFEKSLQFAPKDVATHFNLACAYSLMENAEKAFYHLDQAVKYGFRDVSKIKQHHALAYLRIHEQFGAFEKNGFRLLSREVQQKEQDTPDRSDLLEQLRQLGEMRDKGMLTEQEFAEEKRKLLG